MTRPKNPKAAEKEARIQEAVATVQSGQHNPNSAAIAFKVARQTLYDRVDTFCFLDLNSRDPPVWEQSADISAAFNILVEEDARSLLSN
jgi:hypothetical protein